MLNDLGLVKTALWGMLYSLANNYGHTYISINSLSRITKISKKTISKEIKELIDLDLLFEHPWPDPIPKYLKNIDRRVVLYTPNILKYQNMYPDEKEKNEEYISYEEKLKIQIDHANEYLSKFNGNNLHH